LSLLPEKPWEPSPSIGPEATGKPSPPYDVFLSYSHRDREWVEGFLLKRLEAEGAKVLLIDDRDLLVGDSGVARVEQAVKSSRHTLTVLTPDWLASQWPVYESLLATTDKPLGRKLLPLVLKPCIPPARMAALVYADFTVPSRWEAEFGKLLRSIASTAPLPEPVPSAPVWREPTSREGEPAKSVQSRSAMPGEPAFEYDVAISYAREDGECAEQLAKALRACDLRVFYDKHEKPKLWGKNLSEHLPDVYQNQARYCIILISQHYARKQWTKLELRSAQARALKEDQEYILPVRLDDTEIPGLLDTILYLTWGSETPESIAEAVHDKLFPKALQDALVRSEPVRRGLLAFGDLLPQALQNVQVQEGVRVQDEPVRRGLAALTDLMQEPEVRDAFVAFRVHVQRVSDRIRIVGDYMELHDLLHTLQLHGFDQIVLEAKRFPEDDRAVHNLREHETTLRGIINDLRRVEQRASLPPGELSWIGRDLEPAIDSLHAALEAHQPRGLERTIISLRRVLAIRPSEINTRLNDAVRDLPFPALVRAMTIVCDRIRKLDLDPDEVQQFETGIETLARQGQTLAALVEDHDRWQEVEQELRLTEETWDGTIEGIEDSWSRIRATLEPMTGGSNELWAVPFRQEARRMSEAIATQDPERSRRSFRSFRREASIRFHQVGLLLKDQVDELRTMAEALAALLHRMEA
jgi:TIR domain